MRAISSKKLNSIEKYKFIYHFLPHPYYRQRAVLLSHSAFFVYAFILISFLITFRLLPIYFPGVLGYASNINVSDLLKYTNERREVFGLEPVKLNSRLGLAASKKANDMINVGYWAHISPSGVQPWDFILNEQYDYIYAGENLAKNFSNSKDVVKAWYESPSHRDNLLNPHYDEVGFAVLNGVLDGYETTVVVQMFGKNRVPQQIATVAEVQADQTTRVTNDVVIDQRSVSQSVVFAFGGFIISLLSIDIWYSRKRGILKFTGNTAAHLLFLVCVVLSVVISILPGVIL